MLPASYQLPAAVVLLLSGIISCFFGYRLFRIVLVIFGFIVGAGLASSIFGMSDRLPMLIAVLVGGLIGAALLRAGYFVAVAIIGAVLGVTIANLGFGAANQDPGIAIVVVLAVVGAVAAVYLQRYFIIVGTGFIGAWTMIVGAMALMGDRAAKTAVAVNDVWVFYPLDPTSERS